MRKQPIKDENRISTIDLLYNQQHQVILCNIFRSQPKQPTQSCLSLPACDSAKTSRGIVATKLSTIRDSDASELEVPVALFTISVPQLDLPGFDFEEH
jgi:hypothetical protein